MLKVKIFVFSKSLHDHVIITCGSHVNRVNLYKILARNFLETMLVQNITFATLYQEVF